MGPKLILIITKKIKEFTLFFNITTFKLEDMFGEGGMEKIMEMAITMDIQVILRIKKFISFDDSNKILSLKYKIL